MNFREIVSRSSRPFEPHEWNALPSRFRQEWKRNPRQELLDAAKGILLDGMVFDDPRERPPPGQKNEVRKAHEPHVAATKVKLRAPKSRG